MKSQVTGSKVQNTWREQICSAKEYFIQEGSRKNFLGETKYTQSTRNALSFMMDILPLYFIVILLQL